jgi:hypothetical protein
MATNESNQQDNQQGVISGKQRLDSHNKVARRVVFYKSELEQMLEMLELDHYSRKEFSLALLKHIGITPDSARLEERRTKKADADSGSVVDALRKKIKETLDAGEIKSPEHFKQRLAIAIKKNGLSNDDHKKLLAEFLPSQAQETTTVVF